MRFLVRWAFRLLILLIVLVVAVVLLKNSAAKSWAEFRLSHTTGLKAKIGHVEVGLLTPTLTFANLRLYNPAEFGGSHAVVIPELHVEWNPTALALRSLHFRLVRFHLQEINIVENKMGITNTVALLEEVQKRGTFDTQLNQALGFQFKGIDTLHFSLDRIRYVSMKRPDRVTQLDFDLRNEIRTDIKTLAELPTLIMNAALNQGVTFSTGATPPTPKVKSSP